jgi:dCTP diphosphatase
MAARQHHLRQEAGIGAGRQSPDGEPTPEILQRTPSSVTSVASGPAAPDGSGGDAHEVWCRRTGSRSGVGWPGTKASRLCERVAFAAVRDWQRFHSVRNLLLAVVSEIGECADIVRWQDDGGAAIPPDQQQAWADELADVFILLLRLADRSGVDLPAALHRKLAIAGAKYPVEQFRGSNRKYDSPPSP